MNTNSSKMNENNDRQLYLETDRSLFPNCHITRSLLTALSTWHLWYVSLFIAHKMNLLHAHSTLTVLLQLLRNVRRSAWIMGYT